MKLTKVSKKLWKGITKSLTNKQGSGYILACTVVMVIAVLLSVLFEYFTVLGVVKSNREQMRQELDSYITEYTIENYSAFRQGETYKNKLNEAKMVSEAYQTLAISGSGGTREIKSVDGKKAMCTMTDVKITGISGEQVGIKADYILTVPVTFMGVRFPEARICITVASKFIQI